MKLKIKNEGKPTYKRNKVRWVYEPERLENDLYDIAEKFAKNYAPHLTLSDINATIFNKTLIGPQGNLKINAFRDHEIEVECYRDGWHIKLNFKSYSSQQSQEIRKEVFGDINRNQIWTNETEMVPDLIGKMYTKVREFLEENK